MKKNNFKKIFLCFIIAAAILLSAIPLQSRALEPFDVYANAAILMDAKSGQVIYSKNEHAHLPPAGTLKLFTALLAVEATANNKVSMTDKITVSSDVKFDLSRDAATAGLQIGEVLTLEDLLYLMMVGSANDACNAVAEFISGSVSNFVMLMNERAAELGCTDSNFTNTHGLPSGNQYSSAYDLALIASESLKYPALVKIANLEKYTVPATNMSEERSVRTTNHLLRPGTQMYYYKDAIGLKSGSSTEAGHCLISSVNKSSMSVVSVVLGAVDVQTEPGVFQVQSFTETKRMFEWFFKNFQYKDIIKTSDLLASVDVRFGKGSDTLILRPETGFKLILPNEIDPEKVFEKQIIFILPGDEAGTADAPIERGEKFGEVTLFYNGKTYGPFALIANTSIKLDRGAYILNRAGQALNAAWLKVVLIVVIILAALMGVLALRVSSMRRRRRREAARKRAERIVYRDDVEAED
jgi:D-alanyl-D-alanine carboxypeptidase (penicillin-binding protein 5/6)